MGGIGMITLGLGSIFNIHEAPAIADGIAQVGAQAAAGALNPYGLILTALGVLGVVLKDKAGKKED